VGKLVFVTGGARSGKSSYAESLINEIDGGTEDILYIATAVPFDEEMKARVRNHRERRPGSWKTLEAYKNFDVKLPELLGDRSGVLLDCITNMVSNLILEKYTGEKEIKEFEFLSILEYVKEEIEKLMKVVEKVSIPFVMVTNEVGMSLVPEYPLGRLFRDIAGIVNQIIAKKADEVYLCVSGIEVKIK